MATPEDAGYSIGESPFYEDDQIARYATDDQTVFVEVFTPPPVGPGEPAPDFQRYLDLYDELRTRLLDRGLEAYIPEMIDSDVDEHWVAFGLPEGGLYTLPEVAKSFPLGLDGRDWAWIIRRVLMVLDVGNRRPRFDEQNFLIHPEGHGIVLLGWQPIEDPDLYPLDFLHGLMEKYLVDSVDAGEQTELVRKLADAFKRNRQGQYAVKIDPDGLLLGYREALSEYEMKLERLYGPPRFRELTLDIDSAPYLEDEAGSVRDTLEL